MAKKSSKKSFKMPTTVSYPLPPPCPHQCNSKKCKDTKPPVPLDLSRHVFIWIYGGPAAGKTTQCRKITEKYGFVRLHCGQLLTQEVATGSMRAKLLQNIMDKGELVPNDMVIQLLKSAVESQMGETTGFIIDGYPRNEHQGAMFERNIAPVDVILFVDVSKDLLTTRHLERAAATGKRWDDDTAINYCAAEKVQLRRFFENHKPVLHKYGNKIIRIKCEQKTIDEVFVDCDTVIGKAVDKHYADLRAKLEAIKIQKDMQAIQKERLNRYNK